VDITREIDLMEEVARLEGYGDIPVTFPPIRPSEEGDPPELIVGEKIREIMVGLAFTEIISYSFISPDSADLLGAENGSHLRSFVKLLNPLGVDQSVMRTSLLPGLLSAAKSNISHGAEDLRLFEWGKIFLYRREEELPYEKPFLAAIMTGYFNRKEWYRQERPIDYYDIKGAVEALLKGLGLAGYVFRKGQTHPAFHPGFTSAIYLSGIPVGSVGKISPDVLESFDLKTEHAYLFELDMEGVLEKIQETKKFQAYAKFPAVLRDISFIIGLDVESTRIKEIIERAGGELVESVNIFDLYEGGKVDPSEKAMSFRVCYRSKEGTLDGQEVNELHDKIISKIRQKTGGRLREG
jgi:phenylalanyl-tRNA synthetase beta chain